jgi:hypothetical protein
MNYQEGGGGNQWSNYREGCNLKNEQNEGESYEVWSLSVK